LLHSFVADDRFFALLAQEDARVAAQVKAGGCRLCRGRLDQANYPRKPRGGAIAAAGETQVLRSSFCCCREGCRRRATPPSLVFLGRRLYLAIVVLVEALWATPPAASPPVASPPVASPPAASPPVASSPIALPPVASPPASTVPRRTVCRWRQWFRTTLPQTQTFVAARGWLWPPIGAEQDLPQALVERFGAGGTFAEALVATLRFVSPLTTQSAAPTAPFVGGA
jgi:hypothetical protein